MAEVTVSYGADVRSVNVEENSLLGDAVILSELPLEQPCAGKGTCLKCKVMAQGKTANTLFSREAYRTALQKLTGQANPASVLQLIMIDDVKGNLDAND